MGIIDTEHCPHCGGDLQHDIDQDGYVCRQCGDRFEVHELDENDGGE